MGARVVVLAGRLPSGLPGALRRYGLTPRPIERLEPAALDGAVALITSSEVAVDRALVEGAEGLRVVGRTAAGVDNIDLDACKERGVAVLHTPTEVAGPAAEMTMALLLSVFRRVPLLHRNLCDGVWAKGELPGRELAGKTLGIVGLGRIGGRVALLARAFGMRVMAYDPYVGRGRFRRFGAVRADSLAGLLCACDVVTLHCPLTPETRGMIGAREIANMREGAVLLNLARGGVVDEDALGEALSSGHLWGAGIDCWAREPVTGHPLLALDGVVGTPHMGAGTLEAKERISGGIARSIARTLEGRPVHNRVA